MHGIMHIAYACGLLRLSRISGRNSFLGGENVRPEKFQFLEKGKIVISIKKIQNLFSRSRMTKRISPLESSREI